MNTYFFGENYLVRLLNFFTVVLKFATEQKSFLCRHNSKRRYGDNIEKDEIKLMVGLVEVALTTLESGISFLGPFFNF